MRLFLEIMAIGFAVAFWLWLLFSEDGMGGDK